MKSVIKTVIAATLLALGSAAPSIAQPTEKSPRTVEDGPQFTDHPKSGYYRSGDQRRPKAPRAGGYSYSYTDSVLDARDSSILRDSETKKRQGGPFGSDFFFDSGASRNNNSPYLN